MNILFVCLGNICRSPAAEAVMRSFLIKEQLDETIRLDSAGTVDHHVGDLPDERMRKHGTSRGYTLDMRARQFDAADFREFDLIVTMDESNFRNVCNLAEQDGDRDKVVRMCEFCQSHSEKEVPDPYYGGPDGFELVLDLLEDACDGLLVHLKENMSH